MLAAARKAVQCETRGSAIIPKPVLMMVKNSGTYSQPQKIPLTGGMGSEAGML